MSRNPGGTYTLPGNSFTAPVAGQTINPEHATAFWSDLATELTDSLSRSNKGAMLADLDHDTFSALFEERASPSSPAANNIALFAKDVSGTTLLHTKDSAGTEAMLVSTTQAQILANKTLDLPQINDASDDHQYVFAVSELSADRTVTLPLLTGNDTFVFEAHAQTLTNKTISGASNTLTVRLNADVTGDLPYSNLAPGSALSVLGVTGNAAADVASIAAASDHEVLRRSGSTLGFGAVNLASSNAVTGNLQLANFNGGSGASAATFWRGDGTWAAPAGGGTVTNDSNLTTGALIVGGASGTTAINDSTTIQITSGHLAPISSDGSQLGTSSLMWSDLFLASGGVVNFNNGDVTITHSANTLAFAGAASGYTFSGPLVVTSTSGDAFQVGANGGTNPVLDINCSVASVATGIAIVGRAAGGGAELVAISSGSNETLWIDSKGSGGLNLQTAGTGNLRCDRPVDISAPTGGQIFFPATQNASANANCLDDYEEGTWPTPPALTFATPGNLSVSYTVQSGFYTKIGRLVIANFTILTSSFSHTTASGNLQVTNFPFTAVNGGNTLVAFQGITKAGYTSVVANIIAGAALCTFPASGSGVSIANVVAADMPSGGTVQLVGTICYTT